ncbi:MAG: hypothetical protein WBD40_03535, partial [Tepidisphaeraceae bacterium]
VWTDPAVVGSVRVIHNGVSRLEKSGAYTVGATDLTFTPDGANVLEAIPYAIADGRGTPGLSRRITVHVTASPTTQPTTQPNDPPPPVERVARYDDVIEAIERAEAALERYAEAKESLTASEAELDALRDRLHSSTRPSSGEGQ